MLKKTNVEELNRADQLQLEKLRKECSGASEKAFSIIQTVKIKYHR